MYITYTSSAEQQEDERKLLLDVRSALCIDEIHSSFVERLYILMQIYTWTNIN